MKPKTKILAVDDESMLRNLTVESLATWGYRTVAVGSGTEAITLLQSETDIDMVLTDLNMPGVNGLEVLKWSKQLKEDRPVVVLSGNFETGPANREALGAAGADECFGKPFMVTALQELVLRMERKLPVPACTLEDRTRASTEG
jgi:CheY-like chemotaxis protein